MGSDSSKINNCCSCLEQTQVGESSNYSSVSHSYLYSKKHNMISLQQGMSIIEDSKNPTKNNIILVGEKQSGKTTLLNQLMGKTHSTPYPTSYPETNILKPSERSSRAFICSEVDFEYSRSGKCSSLLNKCEGFIFVIRYDKNQKQQLEQQIRSFSRMDKKQKPSAIVINIIGANNEQSTEQIKQEVKSLLNQYTIKACVLETVADCNRSFLIEMIKQLDAIQIAQVR